MTDDADLPPLDALSATRVADALALELDGYGPSVFLHGPPPSTVRDASAWTAMWHCEPLPDVGTAVARLARHAPGVRTGYARVVDGTTVPGLFLTGGEVRADGDLRLAVAFVCCGHVPPSSLVLSASRDPGFPASLDEPAVRAAFDASLRAVEERVASARDAFGHVDAPAP